MAQTELPETELTFQGHVQELRSRLVTSVGAVMLGFVVAWFLRVPLFDLLSAPIREGLANHGIYHLTAIEVTETIFVYLKISLIAGIMLASPVVFYQLWAFVSPGMYPREKAYITPITMFSVLFFALGVIFCHRILLPFITDFLTELTLEQPDVTIQITVHNTFSLAISLLLAFGVAFELPIVMFFLSLLGIVKPRGYLRFFRYFVVLSFVIGALFTPPDPMSQLLMAGPLNLLYLIGVGLAAIVTNRDKKGPLPTRTWASVGLALTVVVAGIIYAAYVWGRQPTPLDHVPASARAATGVRWADSNSRAMLSETLDAWSGRHPRVESPKLLLERAGLSFAAEDDGGVSEIIVFITPEGHAAAILGGPIFHDASILDQLADRLGEAWSAHDGHLRQSGDDGLEGVWLDEGLVAIGHPAAVVAAQGASDDATALSDVAHRDAAIEAARRSGPIWLIAWSDPLAAGDIFGALAADWDRPIVTAWAQIADESVAVKAELDTRRPARAVRLARHLDMWRDERAAEERAQADNERRHAENQRSAARFSKLIAATREAVQTTREAVAPIDPAAAARLAAPLQRLSELAAEQGAELAAPSKKRARGSLTAEEIPRLQAEAKGTSVGVDLQVTAVGATVLAEAFATLLRQGLPNTLPETLPELAPTNASVNP